jgi:hypothetical protein
MHRNIVPGSERKHLTWSFNDFFGAGEVKYFSAEALMRYSLHKTEKNKTEKNI